MANTVNVIISGGHASNEYTNYACEIEIDTYETGGVDMSGMFKSFTPLVIVGCECVSGTNTYEPQFDFENKKLKLFTGQTEVSSGAITPTKYHVSAFGFLP